MLGFRIVLALLLVLGHESTEEEPVDFADQHRVVPRAIQRVLYNVITHLQMG